VKGPGKRDFAAVLAGLCALAALAGGCSAVLGLDAFHYGDAGAADGPSADAAFDAPSNGDAPSDGAPTLLKLVGGRNFACALYSTGTVWCWGADDYGQLGHIDTTGDQSCVVDGGEAGVRVFPCQPTPSPVNGLMDVTDLAVGSSFACAVLANGSASCWGANQSDQLGHPGTNDRPCPSFDGGTSQPEPCNATPYAVNLLPSSDLIVAGTEFACARTTNAGVFCWGQDYDHELDDDAGQSSASPVSSVRAPHLAGLAASIEEAGQTCALADDGGVFCWGADAYGESGGCDGSLCRVQDEAGVPFTATSVQAGYGASCALHAGSLWCWGTNGFGTFTGAPGHGGTAHPVPAVLPSVTPAFFSYRAVHTLLVDTDGGLWAWGDSTFGELGTPPPTGESCDYGSQLAVTCTGNPQQVLLPGGGPVRKIATGESFSLAETADGTVWAWGSNAAGQLGHISDAGAWCPGNGTVSGPCEWTPSKVPLPP
jgi:alpha-tubulin suppressor-like RCC1 family protein